MVYLHFLSLSSIAQLAGKMGPWPDFFLELCKRFTFQTSIEWLPALDRSKDFLYMGYVCLLILRADEARFVPSNHALNTFLKVSTGSMHLNFSSLCF
jgi:hypothetical protein